MKGKIEKWAKETYQVYETLIKQHDLGFYSQSPLNDIVSPVKVVVMGINPGSGGSFSKMVENPLWKFNELNQPYLHLIRGNVDWVNHTQWRYWQNVMNLLSAAFSDIKETEKRECVFTNATFFNTPKANEVFEELYDKTLACTIKLIEILSPELVVSLSPDNFSRMERVLGKDFKMVKVFGRRLMLGKYKDILFVSIYHPASRYSNAYKNLIQKSLKLIREHRMLGLDNISNLLQTSFKDEWQEVKAPRAIHNNSTKQLALDTLSLVHKLFPEASWQKDVLTISLNGHIHAKVVAQSSKQYVYFRHINWNGKTQYNSSDTKLYEIYSHYREVIDLLLSKGYTTTSTALGEKTISEYNLNNAEELSEAIHREIQEIEYQLKEIFK
ncbi:hypothetical protein [Bacteroides acidifaciens]|uniref:hypothetical protein n=1 Tax=Bacteroides acidifaciens TaxID=85831 RepID=UPI0026769FEB|nr:hypothetical protein [Bacteroides acidifaciens]